jgi:uncharacterized protein
MNKILNHSVVRMLAVIIGSILASVLIKNLITKPLAFGLLADESLAKALVNYLSAIVLLTGYFYLSHLLEKRKPTELSRKYLYRDLLSGISGGFGAISLVILVLYLGGDYHISGLSGYPFFVVPLSGIFIAVLLEELVFRGAIYRALEISLGTTWALIIVSVVFTAAHLFNPNVSILAVVALFVFSWTHCMLFTLTQSVWLPFAFHLGWNLAQPFYGSNLSGHNEAGFVIKATFNGPELLTGTAFGIEDSVLSIFILLLIAIPITLYCYQNGKCVRSANRRVVWISRGRL